MCSIYGAYGRNIDRALLERIRQRARDRGRDGGGMATFELTEAQVATVGSWRATPTTEIIAAPPQPYGGICHNGTIANDIELGNPIGEVDSMILPKVLDLSSADALAASLARIKGSFAISAVTTDRVLLAASYKPIHYLVVNGAVYFSSLERHLAPEAAWGTRPAKVKPYSVLDLRTGQSIDLPRQTSHRALIVASAGLDSTTAAFLVREQGWDVGLLHLRYGARAQARELAGVNAIAQQMNVPLALLDIDYSQFTGGSPLLSGNAPIADGIAGAEFAHEWVPARNLLLLAHAIAYAEANHYGAVVLGGNLEESGSYPDNEEEMSILLDQVLDYAVADGREVRILAPLGGLMKHEVVREGLRLGVPYDLTWSCYRGGTRHCGKCGPCTMRRIAFERNGTVDPVFDGTCTEA